MSRLNPKISTLRRLFLSSGNKCAFPGCQAELVNSYGQYVGNVCHIEAAEREGERYNQHQSDEDRRSYENLILLCSNHHMVTNDVNMYTVDVMKSIKQSHENFVHKNGATPEKEHAFLNSTLGEIINLPNNLLVVSNEIEASFGQDFNIEELVPHAQYYFSKFKGIPPATREFFANLLMISHSEDCSTYVDIREVDVYLKTNIYLTSPHYSILERAGLLTEVMHDEDFFPAKACRWFRTFDRDDMQVWLLQAIRNHYKNHFKQQEFIDLVTELNFNLLDHA